MLLSDITFLLIFMPAALILTILQFVWRGIWIFGVTGGLFWILIGFFCMSRDNSGVTLFLYQRELVYLFIFLGLAITLSPYFVRAKDADIAETDAPDDIDIWAGITEQHRKKVDKHKNLRKRNRKEEE